MKITVNYTIYSKRISQLEVLKTANYGHVQNYTNHNSWPRPHVLLLHGCLAAASQSPSQIPRAYMCLTSPLCLQGAAFPTRNLDCLHCQLSNITRSHGSSPSVLWTGEHRLL